MRTIVAAAVACLSMVGLSVGADVRASIKKTISIPAQGLGLALQAFAKERDIHVVFISEDIGKLRTEGVQGDLTIDEALKELLSGTGLTYQYIDEQTVSILPLATAPAPSAASGRRPGSIPTSSTKEIWSPVRVAQTDPEHTANEGAAEQKSAGSPVKIEEIIVTAQKRSERLQDVPIPMSAISADTLVSSNLTRLQDYYARIPGFSVSPQGTQSAQILSIRGITTGGGNPTVGVVIDDVPYGASISLGGGNVVPDIDPSELARIEVLRGPQGTLYGANSMGGLLKFVTIDPLTEGISGRLQGGFNGVRNGDEVGYSARGAINVPLGDSFAFRASAFTRRDPGYIDDPKLGLEGVNRADFNGGRLSALWRPSEVLSLKLSALLQESEGDGLPFLGYAGNAPGTPGALSYVASNVGDLQQSFLRDTGTYNRETQAYSAILTAKVGVAELTTLSGYNVNSMSDSFDITPSFGGLLPLLGFAVDGAAFFEDQKTTRFTQEIRLSVPLGRKLDWLVGGYYTDEKNSWVQRIAAESSTTGAIAGEMLATTFPTTFEEYAAFMNLTVRFTEQFDLQLGGRDTRGRQSYVTAYTGPGAALLFGANPYNFQNKSKENAFTYLVTPRFKVSPDLMVYARLASGYRTGGPNTTAAALSGGVPLQYDPDKTKNYELGIKGSALDRALSFDASFYYIDWEAIQLNLANSFGSFKDNGDKAKSQGIELSAEAHPLSGLTLSSWAVWSTTVLTEDFPLQSSARGFSGDRLPYSSRFSGNFSVTQEFSLPGGMTGFAGGVLSYVGNRVGSFRSQSQASPLPSLPRQILPAYTTMDLSAGVRYEAWMVDLFVNNVTDKRALLYGGVGGTYTNAFLAIQPRTFGINASRSW